MILNSTLLKNVVAIAKELVSKETQKDVSEIKDRISAAYTELDAVSEIAVEIGLRLYGTLDWSTRALSPISALAEQVAELYKQRFAL